MAKKLKRVDGVSNNKVARSPRAAKTEPSPKRAAAPKPGKAEAVKEAPSRRKPAVRPERAPAQAASAKPRAAAQSRKKEPAAPEKSGRAAKEKARPRKLKEPKEKVRRRDREPGPGPRGLRAVSPRTVILLILVAVFIALSASPVARNFEATTNLRALERELSTQRETTKSLEKEVAQAQSLSYIEQEARRQRLVAPGELLYLVTTDAAGPRVEYRIKALQSMDEAWERVRQMLHCTASRQTKEP
jgi:hypothetical protein